MKNTLLFLASLSLIPLPLVAEETFKAYDANQDGTVTYAELARGKKADFDKMDRNRDKMITPTEFAAPASEEKDKYDLFATPEFKLIDSDSNQLLSLAEFGKSVAAMINRCDTNADNAVSLEEYQKVISDEKAKAAAAAAPPKGSAPKGSAPKKGSTPKPPAES